HKLARTELPLDGPSQNGHEGPRSEIRGLGPLAASATPLAQTSAPPPSAGAQSLAALVHSFGPHPQPFHAADSQIGAALPASILPVPESAEDSHAYITHSHLDLWPK